MLVNCCLCEVQSVGRSRRRLREEGWYLANMVDQPASGPGTVALVEEVWACPKCTQKVLDMAGRKSVASASSSTAEVSAAPPAGTRGKGV